MTDALSDLAQRFQRFADVECRGVSPLYERLASAIAGDPALLAIADHAKQREAIPNLLLAAVHYLVLTEPDNPLRRHYPSVGGTAGDDPFPDFRDFCLVRVPQIIEMLATKLVQTNEVRRAACLLPAFCLASQRGSGRPLAIVEIGASAGLLLLWDRYRYDYGDGSEVGDGASPVLLSCTLRGPHRPALPKQLPTVASRIGLDLNPLEMRDPDAVAWLKALVWPDETDRIELLGNAIALARKDPPRLLAGDALELLPQVLAEMPPDSTACVLRAFTPGISQERLTSLLIEHSAHREIFLIRVAGATAELTLTRFYDGSHEEQLLAHCDAHGEWLEWAP